MTRERVARRVAQKEILQQFASPVAWLFLASFAGASFFIVFWVEAFFARNAADIRPLFEWMPALLIFLAAALTMRGWSDERRSGTLEHVLTQPAGLWQFVWGKFCACFTLLLLALVATAPLPLTVALLADLDWGPVVAAYLATCLLGATYLSAGLFVSSRTDNPIVSLIGTVALCGALYLVGSPLLTNFFDTDTGEVLRSLGSGARFVSISRGVLDVRDLCYYLSLTLAFLSLNVYCLEKQRWSGTAATPRHRYWRGITALVLLNLLLANTWLARIDTLRLDITEGRQYSLSAPTLRMLGQLQEPLLIRGYFSAKTHPLLAPLVAQLRDLLKEYAVAGRGQVRVEFIDPAQQPAMEREANERYAISATPVQVADRYQTTLVNSYFNLLVQYGDEYQVLGFKDLIEVRTRATAGAEVMLRNPEYDITRALKSVLHNYQMGGSLFQRIDEPVELIAYVSADSLLPDALRAYRQSIEAQLEAIVPRSEGKFSVRFIEPEARAGTVARQIAEQWGFRPMLSAPDTRQPFYFYLTLADTKQVVQLPTGDFDPAGFRTVLDAGLKRFASGFTRTVALATPQVSEQMARYHLGGPTFNNLEQAVARDYSIVAEDLTDGTVSPEADILAVIAPHQLSERAVFAIDQFLMRGGTVILASSPYTAELSDGELNLRDWDSGLASWLAFQGLDIGQSLVLDQRNALFPAPVLRQSGGHSFRDVRMLDYPYFIDLRGQGLPGEHPVTANLPQLTMAWASPITATHNNGRHLDTLLRSSPESWLSNSRDIMPGAAPGDSGAQQYQPQTLGVTVQGRFESFFSEPPAPLHRAGLLQHSTESARLILYSSNDFLDDQILRTQVMASGTQYLGPVELLLNTLDWALQDGELLKIRSRAHFNRTLPPMEQRQQAVIEYLNYGLALCWLGLLALVHWLRKRMRRARYQRELGL